jgi:hypothetical protein
MKIDMNPHSITMRIKKTSELRRLCIALGGDRLKERLQNDQIRTVVSDSPAVIQPGKSGKDTPKSLSGSL